MNKLPSTQTMYRALLRRDTTFEGLFYVGVKTTKIFCRPTCPAKKPKFENVEYFSCSTDALYAGYRPCSRCSPLEQRKEPPALVKQLRDLVERSPIHKITSSELRSMEIDPSTARRQFQRYYGMTFHAYQRARKMGLALQEIHDGESVIAAQVRNGFESASGFWEAFRKIFGTPPSQAEQVNCLYAKWIETPLGAMIALASSEGLYLLEFVDRRGLENEMLTLRKRTQCTIVPGNNIHLDKIAQELKNYFEGTAIHFTVPIVMTGSPFEKRVWEFLRMIPWGQTRSYAQLAEAVERPSATRAVGRANGKNCLALVIPCHRVIRSDGNLCGYGGGLWRKQWLLDHERGITLANGHRNPYVRPQPNPGF